MFKAYCSVELERQESVTLSTNQSSTYEPWVTGSDSKCYSTRTVKEDLMKEMGLFTEV